MDLQTFIWRLINNSLLLLVSPAFSHRLSMLAIGEEDWNSMSTKLYSFVQNGHDIVYVMLGLNKCVCVCMRERERAWYDTKKQLAPYF